MWPRLVFGRPTARKRHWPRARKLAPAVNDSADDYASGGADN
ncbi:MAG: hypothetical protein QOF93_880 [Verrucomicrobiota bacterium]